MSESDGPIIEPDKVKPRFKRSDLRDVEFFRANEAAILDAVREGRVIDDVETGKLGLGPKDWHSIGDKR